MSRSGPNSNLDAEVMACLRRMVAWQIAGVHTNLRQGDLDREFGRNVWERVAAAGLLESTMYECHRLKLKAVEIAMGWR